MEVGFVVNDFPVLSESFIVRSVEGLLAEDVNVTVFALSTFCKDDIEQNYPFLLEALRAGKLKVISGSGNSFRDRTFDLIRAAFRNPLALFRAVGLGLSNGIRIKNILKSLLLIPLLERKKSLGIVHAQYFNLSVCVILSKKALGYDRCHAVCTIRGADISRTGGVSENEVQLINSSDIIIFSVSQSLAVMAKEQGVDKSIKIIHSPVSVGNIRFMSAERAAAQARVKLLQVGRMVPKKGFELTLKMLKQHPQRDKFEVTFIGEGPQYEPLKTMVDSARLGGLVYFAGPMRHDHVLKLISAADILVVPSRKGEDGDSEGIPNVAKEAMAAGTIVVSSNHSGMPELIQDNVTGFIFEENCPSSYVASIEHALAAYRHWPEIRQKARKLIENEYSIENVTKKTIDIYSKL